MDPFPLVLAVGPLAVYLLRLARINARRKPLVVTGSRERIALGVALSGFVIVGPMQLFMPDDAASNFGPFVWVLMLAFYSLCVSLLNLLARPRLGVYNVALDRSRSVLTEVALAIDDRAYWAGNRLTLPQAEASLDVEGFPLMRHVALVASPEPQNHATWHKLELALRDGLAGVVPPRGVRAPLLAAAALAMIVLILYRALDDPQAVVDGLRDLLQM